MINLIKTCKAIVPILILGLLFSTFSCATTKSNVSSSLEGHAIDAPVDKEALRKSIQYSLSEYSWKIVESEEDIITASYSKNGIKILAEIRIIISGDSYTINYIDKPERNIPGRYNNWVRNLNKRILTNYYRM